MKLVSLTLVSLYNTSTTMKLIICYLLSSILWPFFDYFETFVFSDWETAGYMVTALFLDAIVGIIKHYLKKSLDKVGLQKFMIRAICVFSALILCHLVRKISPHDSTLFQSYLPFCFNFTILFYLGFSVCQNLDSITDGKFPPRFVMARFKIFEDTGDINALKGMVDQKNPANTTE